MIEGLFNAGYSIWNALIDIVISLFTTSPKAASPALTSTIQTLFNSLKAAAFPLAVVFFLIALIRDVVSTPPDQQLKKFIGSAIKYCVILGIIENLWNIMGYVMGFADGVTSAFSNAGGSNYYLSMNNDLQSAIAEAGQKPDVTIHLTSLGDDLKDFISAWWDHALAEIIMLISGLVTLFIVIASSISLINSAFQRIFKPMVILPFASIAVAMGAGTGEASRVMSNYLKTFLGYCLSGAFMVICVKMSVALMNDQVISSLNFDSASLIEKTVYACVQNAVMPLVCAGLVKSADSVIQRFF